MAFATELTVATGQTLYTGDPESDERIHSREVRVSVTYQLERDDTDILLLTAVKAAEVAKAHQTACQQMQQELQQGLLHREPTQPPRAAGAPQPLASQTEEDEDTEGDQEEPEEDEDEGEASRFAQPITSRPGYNGHHAQEGNGYAGNSPHSSNTARGYIAPAAAQEPTEPMATKPLQLAIRAAATRHGLSEYALSTVLRERFHTFRLEKLTKEQATSLLQALNNGEIATPAAGQASHASTSRTGSRH